MRNFALFFLLIPSLWMVPIMEVSGISLPSNVDHSSWSALLGESVDERGLSTMGGE